MFARYIRLKFLLFVGCAAKKQVPLNTKPPRNNNNNRYTPKIRCQHRSRCRCRGRRRSQRRCSRLEIQIVFCALAFCSCCCCFVLVVVAAVHSPSYLRRVAQTTTATKQKFTIKITRATSKSICEIHTPKHTPKTTKSEEERKRRNKSHNMRKIQLKCSISRL